MVNNINETSLMNVIISNERQIKLIVLLPFQVLSLFFSLFILINMFYYPSKYIKPIQNHFLLALLLTSFVQVSTELSMVEDYLNVGFVRPSTPSYCAFFNWFEFTLNGVSLSVMCWASIERHLIIFSNNIYQNRWNCLMYHYIPLFISIVYCPICYTYLIYIYECINHWNYRELLCTSPCFYQNRLYGASDWLLNIICPSFTIVISNLILIIRIVCRSTNVTNNIQRRKKNRKMTLQLLLISSLFLVFWFPISITGLIQQFISPTFLIYVQFNIFFYLIYFIQLFIPFVCFTFLPDLSKSVQYKYRRWRRGNTVDDRATFQMATIIRGRY